MSLHSISAFGSAIGSNINSDTLKTALSLTSPVAVLLLAAGATLHCSLMCGPLVASIRKSSTWTFGQHQLGRMMSYAIAGLLASVTGHAIKPHPVLVTLFLILATITVIFQLFQISLLPFWGRTLINGKIMTPLHRLANKSGRFQAFGMGLLTPLIPCGQLWIVLAFAAVASNPLEGAGIALAFSLLSAPGVFGFRFLKDKILGLGTTTPLFLKIGLRSIIIFVFALSAFKFSTLTVTQSAASISSDSSKENGPSAPPICH